MDTFNCKLKEPANKFWYTTDDGEFAMGTGGMRYYEFKKPSSPAAQKSLPEFLTAEATQQLFELPAKVRELKATNVDATSATINLSMAKAGTNSSVEIYYGETDCLTFAKRKLHGTERNSAISQSTQAEGRLWSHNSQSVPLNDGDNDVTLRGLKRATNYYFRALITNDEGKLWSFQTKSLRPKS